MAICVSAASGQGVALSDRSANPWRRCGPNRLHRIDIRHLRHRRQTAAAVSGKIALGPTTRSVASLSGTPEAACAGAGRTDAPSSLAPNDRASGDPSRLSFPPPRRNTFAFMPFPKIDHVVFADSED